MKGFNFLKISMVIVFIACACLLSTGVYAETPIRIMHYDAQQGNFFIRMDKIDKMVKDHFDVKKHDRIDVQVMLKDRKPAYVIVYLFPTGNHFVDIARINITKDYDVLSVEKNYVLRKHDIPVSKTHAELYSCPDDTIQFIAFAPNNNDLEQSITKDVAAYAQSKGLNTISLLIENATRANFLNYASCLGVVGIFYDGDGNQVMITAIDGCITAEDIGKLNFGLQTTNYWIAADAYADPLKSAVMDSAHTQKFATGANSLEVGPSDRAAACAMKAALDRQQLSTSFQSCYKEYDKQSDQWGFGGSGSDWFTWNRK